MPQVIIDQPGPLPINTRIRWPSSNPVVMAVSGSAYGKTANSMLAVQVSVGLTNIVTLSEFANPAGTHMAFPTAFPLVSNGVIGDAPLSITAATPATLTDSNDRFTITLIY
jgi:hypothetical protein